MTDNTTKQTSALLIMDVQTRIVSMIKEHDELITNIKKAVKQAHAMNLPVIYVKVAFRSGFPEVSPNNKSFSQIKQNATAFADANSMEIFSEIMPEKDDIIVTKRRVSAFTGSDLEVILRSQGINHLILSGIATSGVVLSTLREAADKDYQLTVLSDCCADSDAEVHTVLIAKVFPRQAEVLTAKDWIKQSNNKTSV
ncbi:MAG: cysteine hydrolase family protein [Candidatus Levyibacteriota bacterium]